MRNINELQLKSQALAKAFNGLPKGYTHFNLCDDLADGRSLLGLDSDCICLLHFLIKRSRTEDWKTGAQPIVGWSRFYVCHYFGWSEDKLRRVEKTLADGLFIAFIDSANCKRFLNRNADGSISDDSGGLSLAPLGTRLREIVTAAHVQREEAKTLFTTYGEIFRVRSELLKFSKCKELHKDLSGLAAVSFKKLPSRRSQKLGIAELRAMLTGARELMLKLRTYLGITEFDAAEACAPAAAEIEQEEATAAEADAQVKRAPAADCGRKICAVSLQPLHRKNAEHKVPDSNSLKKDSNILGILTAAPEIFQAYLDHEHSRSSLADWESSLTAALVRYASDLALKPSFVNKISTDYGYANVLQAVFALSRMTEKGAIINNPAGYTMALARQRAPVMQ